MGSGEWINSAASVRSEIDKEVFGVVEELMGAGWRLRRQGHKFRIYCPCPDGDATRATIAVNGTPKNPSTHARQVRRAAAHCPDRHELM